MDTVIAHFKPSPMPGPLNDLILVRLALSKLALNTNSKPRASATALMAAHNCMQCSSLSITLGPAIRKNGDASRSVSYERKFMMVWTVNTVANLI